MMHRSLGPPRAIFIRCRRRVGPGVLLRSPGRVAPSAYYPPVLLCPAHTRAAAPRSTPGPTRRRFIEARIDRAQIPRCRTRRLREDWMMMQQAGGSGMARGAAARPLVERAPRRRRARTIGAADGAVSLSPHCGHRDEPGPPRRWVAVGGLAPAAQLAWNLAMPLRQVWPSPLRREMAGTRYLLSVRGPEEAGKTVCDGDRDARYWSRAGQYLHVVVDPLRDRPRRSRVGRSAAGRIRCSTCPTSTRC